MAELVTYRDIATKFGVGIQTARKWGSEGWLGKRAPVRSRDHLYVKSKAFAGAAKVYDRRMKLSDEDVREIRERGAAGESSDELAAAFEVHVSYVRLILNNKRRVV